MSHTPSEEPSPRAGEEPAQPNAVVAPTKIEQASGLWARIKEHKILQWGLGYLAVAFALGQAAGLLADTFDWPPIVARVVMIVLALGLPVVLTLAWYHGHQGLKRFSAAEMSILVVLLLIGAGLLFAFVRPDGSRGGAETRSTLTLPSPSRERVAEAAPAQLQTGEGGATSRAPPTQSGVTLAVLPFVNLSGDASQEYFSDGLSEELLDRLAKLKGLRVTARTSSFAFKGKNEDMRVIGQTLGVANLLEGSVRKSGTRLKITAQLINAGDGTHLWSNTYDRELTDVFEVQEDIGKAVAQALSITLGVGEAQSAGTKNVEAYDLYLKGRAAAAVGGPEGYRQALQFYRQAVAADPSFVAGWTGVAEAALGIILWVPEQTAAARAEVVGAAKHLSALSLNSAQALGLQVAQAALIDHDHPAAGRALDQLLAIDPAGAQAISIGLDEVARGRTLAIFGRISEALEHVKTATLADPLSLDSSILLQWVLDMAGRYPEAEAEYQRTKDLPGANGQAQFERVARLWVQGADPALAKAQLALIAANGPGFFPLYKDLVTVYGNKTASLALLKRAFDDPFYQDGTRLPIIAVLAAHYGDQDLALAAARRGLVDKKGPGIFGLWKPEFAEARKDPRFEAIVTDLGLVTYWRESGNWGDFCKPVGTDDFECR